MHVEITIHKILSCQDEVNSIIRHTYTVSSIFCQRVRVMLLCAIFENAACSVESLDIVCDD